MKLMLIGLLFACFQDKAQWDEVRSKEGNFLIWMPAKPEASSEESDTVSGRLLIHRWICRINDRAYVLVYSDYSKELCEKLTADAMIVGDIEALIKGVGGKETKRKAVTMAKNPGRAAWFDTEDGRTGEVRAYLVGRRMYMVLGISKKDVYDESEARKVIDSLKLIEE